MKTDEDVAIVLFGSWGRRKLTEHSDDDWLLLVDGPLRDGLAPDVEEVRSLLGAGDRRPGTQGAFGTVSPGAISCSTSGWRKTTTATSPSGCC